MRKTAFAAAVILATGFSPSANAQAAPSWRSDAERPQRVQAPPEVETPDISFEIDREALFGKPMGFAPEQELSEPQAPEEEPKPGVGSPDKDQLRASLMATSDAQTAAQEPSEWIAVDQRPAALPEQDTTGKPSAGPVGKKNASEALDAASSVPEAAALAATPEVKDSLALEPAAARRAQQPKGPVIRVQSGLAADERQTPVTNRESEALALETRVNPGLSMASINQPAPIHAAKSPSADTFRLVRTRTVQPEYPRDAARLGEEGWVDLRLTVAPSGRVSDVDVLDAQPRQLFDAAARRAARQWRFEPPRDAGIDEPQSAMIRLTFVMD